MKTAPKEPHVAKSQPLLQRGVSWSDHDDFEFRRVEPKLDPLLKGQDMRILILSAGAALFLAACDSKQENAEEAAAQDVRASGEATADAMENQADAATTDAAADSLNAQADAVQQKADEKADAVEAAAGNLDGGMTTPPAKTN